VIAKETADLLAQLSAEVGGLSVVMVKVIERADTPDTVLIAAAEAMAANLRMVKAIGVYVQGGEPV